MKKLKDSQLKSPSQRRPINLQKASSIVAPVNVRLAGAAAVVRPKQQVETFDFEPVDISDRDQQQQQQQRPPFVF